MRVRFAVPVNSDVRLLSNGKSVPEVRAVNLLLTLLISAAILTSVFTIGTLVLWWKGVNAIALPGTGLIVATPLMVLLLLIVEVVIVLVAILAGSLRGKA